MQYQINSEKNKTTDFSDKFIKYRGFLQSSEQTAIPNNQIHHNPQFRSLIFFLWGRSALSQHLLPIFLFLLEEDGPWANICASLPPFCILDAATARLDEWCWVRAQDPNPQTPGHRSWGRELNHYTTGPALRSLIFRSNHLQASSVVCTWAVSSSKRFISRKQCTWENAQEIFMCVCWKIKLVITRMWEPNL